MPVQAMFREADKPSLTSNSSSKLDQPDYKLVRAESLSRLCMRNFARWQPIAFAMKAPITLLFHFKLILASATFSDNAQLPSSTPSCSHSHILRPIVFVPDFAVYVLLIPSHNHTKQNKVDYLTLSSYTVHSHLVSMQ